jgi:hypothetical protein
MSGFFQLECMQGLLIARIILKSPMNREFIYGSVRRRSEIPLLIRLSAYPALPLQILLLAEVATILILRYVQLFLLIPEYHF